MSAFLVSCLIPRYQGVPLGPPPDLERLGVRVDGGDRLLTKGNNLAVMDGYVLNGTFETLAAAVEANDGHTLSRLHGHFSLLLIRPNGEIVGYRDRIGGKALFWATTDDGLVISSRWEAVARFGSEWDHAGLSEMLYYRWTSGTATVLGGVSRLPQWQTVRFAADGSLSTSPSGQEPDAPSTSPDQDVEAKIDETGRALHSTVADIAEKYDRAAVFLSGGVDSSLLAAVSAEVFDEVLLVSPVFSGENSNPELPAAREAAEAISAKHLLVEIDEARLEPDLRLLVRLNGSQIRFHTLAMQQMMAAIPDEFSLVLLGDAADTFFGATRFKRTETLVRRKQRLGPVLSPVVLRLLSLLPGQKAENLRHLGEESLPQFLADHFKIAYNGDEMAAARKLCPERLDDTYIHHAAHHLVSHRYPAVRAVLQDIALRVEIPHTINDIELSADTFGKRLFAPFFDARVHRVGLSLSAENYYGKEFPKPVLRELGCRYFSRSHMYRKKHGFEIPYEHWLRGPLSGLVEEVRDERQQFDGRLLGDLRIERGRSLYWSLINWRLIHQGLVDTTDYVTRTHNI